VSFAAQMRLGSLEIAAVLVAALVALAVPRRVAAVEALPAAFRTVMHVIELGADRRFEGISPLVIGRDRQAELVLGDPEVSRRHARLEVQRGVVFLRDLESKNGTFLNGHRVRTPIEVREGDEIDVGTTRLVVEALTPWT
jgi:pSer/pThr/pTyr-binding forkhead associated (FHA) protein